MDFLNKAVSQVTELFKGMTPGARMTSGMLLAMIVISLVYLVAFKTGGADRYLFGSQEFTNNEISTMQQAFAQENLDDYKLEGKRVRVPRGRMTLYLQALTKAGFSPEDIEKDIMDVAEMGGSIFQSEKEREFWRSQAYQQKLARAIAKRPEIDWATVKFSEIKTRGFPPKTERSAAVVVGGANSLPVPRTTIRAIRYLASSWFGIRAEEVAVSDQHGDTFALGEHMDGMSPEARHYSETKRNYEADFQRKIEHALSYIREGVIATVNVQLDPTLHSESSKIKVDPQTVPIESETSQKTTETRPAKGGRPGAAPNEVPGNQPRTLMTTVNTRESTSDESHEQQSSVMGHEQTHQLMAALTPKLVTASVSIPMSYVRKVWEEENEPAPGETPMKLTPAEIKAQIEAKEADIIQEAEDKVVKSITPQAPGESQYPHVDVSTYYDFEEDPPEEPTMVALAGVWFFENWKTLGLFVIGVISLFVLRSMIRAATPPASVAPAAVELPTSELAQAEEEEEDEEAQAVLHRKAQPSGMSLREELISMVREDPDAAANVLRTWIGDAA